MKTGFGHFLDFGTWDGLDIAYFDSTKCFAAFDNGNGSMDNALIMHNYHNLCI